MADGRRPDGSTWIGRFRVVDIGDRRKYYDDVIVFVNEEQRHTLMAFAGMTTDEVQSLIRNARTSLRRDKDRALWDRKIVRWGAGLVALASLLGGVASIVQSITGH